MGTQESYFYQVSQVPSTHIKVREPLHDQNAREDSQGLCACGFQYVLEGPL